MYKIQLELFEGPLDLLLRIIEQKKMAITDIALGDVTEDYLRYLAENQEHIDARELADFLTIAAKLLLIKSREILPLFHFDDDEEDARELERQLKMYKQYWEAAKKIRKIIGRHKFAYVRDKPITRKEVRFSPPAGVTTGNLCDFFAEILARLEPVIHVPKQVMKDTINIQHRIARISAAIAEHATVNFRDMLLNSKSKTDVIVSFLAVLELVKMRTLSVRQDARFGDIVLARV